MLFVEDKTMLDRPIFHSAVPKAAREGLATRSASPRLPTASGGPDHPAARVSALDGFLGA